MPAVPAAQAGATTNRSTPRSPVVASSAELTHASTESTALVETRILTCFFASFYGAAKDLEELSGVLGVSDITVKEYWTFKDRRFFR
jgi:hypothetical protein